MTASALGEEGIWLFDAPPLQQLKEKYQFEPTPRWLEQTSTAFRKMYNAQPLVNELMSTK
jgi:hypothetical protein